MSKSAVCTLIANLVRDDSGQDVVEYGLLVALIAVIVLAGISAFGNQVQPWFLVLAGRITTTGT